LLGGQNTTRRLSSTFPQIVFPSKAGFTLSRLSINYIAFMTPLDIQRMSVRPDKYRDVQLTISGKTRMEWRNKGKEEMETERSKEKTKIARKVKDRLSNVRCNFFRQHSPLHLHNPSVANTQVEFRNKTEDIFVTYLSY